MPELSTTRRLAARLRGGGLRWLLAAVGNRVFPARPHMRRTVCAAVTRRRGLEVGGPSRVFAAGQLLPVYRLAAGIDNVNFAAQTAWEAGLKDGGDFTYDVRLAPGRQYIREAAALTGIADAAYDFVLSSHCLEHVANPLRALREWRRVTRPGGHLVLILPDATRSFDHRRPITTIEHLRADFAADRGEDDRTHVPEVLALHDLGRDPWAGSRASFQERLQRNHENRCLHHHVFDLALMAEALRDTGWDVLALESARPVHLIAFARKSP